MAQDSEKMTVDISDFNQLIELITKQNIEHDSQHSQIIKQISLMNKEHEKRYTEFYDLVNRMLRDLKNKVNNHENRIKGLEARVGNLEKEE